MATCPRCMGALTENHRCPKGRFSRLGPAVLTLIAGSGAGAMLCYAIEGQPPGSLVLSSAALGAVLAYAMRQAMTPRF
jgi:uncharacterized paraquat-inducible protein A